MSVVLMAINMARSIFCAFSLAHDASTCALTAADPTPERHRRRPEDLVLNPQLVGSRAAGILGSRPAGRRVDDSAAVVDQRLEDLL